MYQARRFHRLLKDTRQIIHRSSYFVDGFALLHIAKINAYEKSLDQFRKVRQIHPLGQTETGEANILQLRVSAYGLLAGIVLAVFVRFRVLVVVVVVRGARGRINLFTLEKE